MLESAAARNLLDYVLTFQVHWPALRAEALPCAGGVAAYTGPESPLTTVKGAGPEISDGEIDAAEGFFRRQRAGRVVFECAPWLSAETCARLERRGYRLEGTEAVMAMALPADTEPVASPLVELAEESWARVFPEAFELPPEECWPRLARVMWHLAGAVNLGAVDASGVAVACAQLAPAGTVAVLGNDGTVAAARGAGLQTALIRERVRRAGVAGFAVAMSEVAEGSGSQRNYERCGFERVYARTSWVRSPEPARVTVLAG